MDFDIKNLPNIRILGLMGVVPISDNNKKLIKYTYLFLIIMLIHLFLMLIHIKVKKMMNIQIKHQKSNESNLYLLQKMFFYTIIVSFYQPTVNAVPHLFIKSSNR